METEEKPRESGFRFVILDFKGGRNVKIQNPSCMLKLDLRQKHKEWGDENETWREMKLPWEKSGERKKVGKREEERITEGSHRRRDNGASLKMRKWRLIYRAGEDEVADLKDFLQLFFIYLMLWLWLSVKIWEAGPARGRRGGWWKAKGVK